MRPTQKYELQTCCPKKRWTVAIGNHHNIVIHYSRYPLDGSLDISMLLDKDFEHLAAFFRARKPVSMLTTANKKWSFYLDAHYCLTIKFNHYPFTGELGVGEMSVEHCIQLSDMFRKAITQ